MKPYLPMLLSHIPEEKRLELLPKVKANFEGCLKDIRGKIETDRKALAHSFAGENRMVVFSQDKTMKRLEANEVVEKVIVTVLRSADDESRTSEASLSLFLFAHKMALDTFDHARVETAVTASETLIDITEQAFVYALID